jgi:hypothetical protein
MTNALRLSAGVAGLAKVGVVNCEEEEAQVQLKAPYTSSLRPHTLVA